jgi:hypothetical protein
MSHPPCVATALIAVAILFGNSIASADDDWLAGFANFETLTEQLTELATDDRAELSSLGKTSAGRDVWLLTIGGEQASKRPGILVMGAVAADQIFTSEMAVGMAHELLTRAKSDEETAGLLDEVTFYFIPRPSPDASERVFGSLANATAVNLRSTDDDRDGRTDEDPYEDLDGNAVLTKMRVEDATGEWISHPDDPRLMIRADRAKGEQGKYRLLSEGVDNDQDEKWNEDGPGGVDFNRNFTFEYPYFATGSGPHQISEPESRAVADFAFDHGNIYLVLSLAPQDNLAKPWTPANNESGRIKTKVLKADVPYFKEFSQDYTDAIKPKDVPAAGDADGSFVHWAYFHYGRWSLATPGWWVPKVGDANKPAAKESNDDSNNEAKDETQEGAKEDSSEEQSEATAEQPGENTEAKPAEKSADKPDARASDELNALAWLASIDRDGFVAWNPIEHPDFPDRKVEVGGFRPHALTLPPHKLIDERVAPHTSFLLKVARHRARLSLVNVEVEPLGGGLYRLEAIAINGGSLPTMSAMGELSSQLQRVELALELPDDASLLTGTERYALPVLESHGGSASRHWLVRLATADQTAKVTFKLGAPSVGHVSQELVLEPK